MREAGARGKHILKVEMTEVSNRGGGVKTGSCVVSIGHFLNNTFI